MSTSNGVDISPLVDRVNRAFYWRRNDKTIARINKPLTDELITAHLNGGNKIGACPIVPGTATTRIGLLDIDNHHEDLSINVEEIAMAIVGTGRGAGLHGNVWRSTGGKGIHVYYLWEDPQDARTVRVKLSELIGLWGFKPGTKGAASNEIEIFPKQDRVAPDRYGSMFILPGAGKSVPIASAWTLSAPLTPLPSPPRTGEEKSRGDSPPSALSRDGSDAPHAANEEMIAELRSLIALVPNTGDATLSYEEWRDCVFALHDATQGSHYGLALAHELSQKSGKYSAEFLEQKVWQYATSARDRPITLNTLRAVARRYAQLAIMDADLGTGAVGTAPVGNAQKGNAQKETAPQVRGAEVLQGEETTAEAIKTNPTPKRQGMQLTSWDEMLLRPPPTWLIKDVLPSAEVCFVYGPPSCGKSFFTLDIALAIARGLPDWRGHRIHSPGHVTYLAAEGIAGFVDRMRAYHEHNGLDILDSPNFSVLDASPDLLDIVQVKKVIDLIRAHAHPTKLLVIDTLAQVSAGANENEGESMSVLVKHAQLIARACGCMVLFVHHSGKDSSKGLRGWSGFLGAADCTIEVEALESRRVATVRKLKDGREGRSYYFSLTPVDIRLDQDGAPVSSCIVEYLDEPVGAVSNIVKRERVGALQRMIMKVMRDVGEGSEATARIEDVIAYVVPQLPFDSARRDRRREYVLQGISKLQEIGAVDVLNGRVSFVENDQLGDVEGENTGV